MRVACHGGGGGGDAGGGVRVYIRLQQIPPPHYCSLSTLSYLTFLPYYSVSRLLFFSLSNWKFLVF